MVRKLTEMEMDASMEMSNIVSGNSSTRTDKQEKISQILESWIELENYSVEKYGFLANQTTNPHAKVLFERLSSVGERHAKILGIIKEILTETGEIDQSMDIASHVAIPKATESRRYATDVEATYHAMKSHLKLEQELNETYKEIAGKIKDPKATLLFRGLAEDERSHHGELLAIIKSFEKTFKDILRQ